MRNNNFNEQFQARGYATVTLTASDIQLHNHPGKFTLLLLCTGGTAVVEFNMEKFQLAEGSWLCYTHVMQFNSVSVSQDFTAHALVMGEQFALEALVGIDTESLQNLFSTPVAQIDAPEHWLMVMHLYESLRSYGMPAAGRFHPEVPRAIFRSMMIVLGEMHRQQHHHPAEHHGYTMTDTYFRSFINLINEHVNRQHEVAFYADLLHITPKYLNEICKHKSGHKAKEIISVILTNLLKRELMYTGKSMKELAAEFGFADQSSLGKFFRKQTGLSPLTYKHQQLSIE